MNDLHASISQDICDFPINTQALMARCMGNSAFARSLLSELATTISDRCHEFSCNASDKDYDALGEAAHSLKGTASVMCAESVRDLSLKIETASQARDEETVDSLVSRLLEELERCREFISAVQAIA